MYIQPHDVEHEFPEYRQTLEEMRSSDSHLAQLVAEYEQLNSEIVKQAERSLRAALDALQRYRFAFDNGYADLIYLNLLDGVSSVL